jgi:hypothetical protein
MCRHSQKQKKGLQRILTSFHTEEKSKRKGKRKSVYCSTEDATQGPGVLRQVLYH